MASSAGALEATHRGGSGWGHVNRRQRNIEAWVERLHGIFRAEALRHSPRVEDAFGQQARALLLQLDAVRVRPHV